MILLLGRCASIGRKRRARILRIISPSKAMTRRCKVEPFRLATDKDYEQRAPRNERARTSEIELLRAIAQIGQDAWTMCLPEVQQGGAAADGAFTTYRPAWSALRKAAVSAPAQAGPSPSTSVPLSTGRSSRSPRCTPKRNSPRGEIHLLISSWAHAFETRRRALLPQACSRRAPTAPATGRRFLTRPGFRRDGALQP